MTIYTAVTRVITANRAPYMSYIYIIRAFMPPHVDIYVLGGGFYQRIQIGIPEPFLATRLGSQTGPPQVILSKVDKWRRK